MKKTMRTIFDEANASEIGKLVDRNAAPDVPADTLSSIKQKVYAKTGLANSQKKRSFVFRWQSYVAAAACLAVIVSAILIVPVFRGDNGDSFSPITYDATVSPEKVSGSSLEFLVGSSASVGVEPNAEPPRFDFDATGFVVKAKVVKNYPGLYYKLDVDPAYKPSAYRLIQMECMEVLHGKDVPQHFLYLISDALFVDMSVYDSLLISMSQLGTNNYVLKNDTEKQMEALPMPVFADYQDHPELGNMIAFSDGLFDESLWQNRSWIYGYQFAWHYLEEPQHSHLVVKRGDSESDVIDEINGRIANYKQWLGESYQIPTLATLNVSTQAAKDALEYVNPFANGVFSQNLFDRHLIFRRYINGCQTEETVEIDLLTEEVTYSEVRYTNEEMSKIENISAHLSEKAKAYAEQIPIPPHTDPEGKELLCLNLYAWYAKVDGKLYGVVKTVWRHVEDDNRYHEYYDEAYTLYDMSAATAKDVSREELVGILGPRNVGRGQFGVGIEMPMC